MGDLSSTVTCRIEGISLDITKLGKGGCNYQYVYGYMKHGKDSIVIEFQTRFRFLCHTIYMRLLVLDRLA